MMGILFLLLAPLQTLNLEFVISLTMVTCAGIVMSRTTFLIPPLLLLFYLSHFPLIPLLTFCFGGQARMVNIQLNLGTTLVLWGTTQVFLVTLGTMIMSFGGRFGISISPPKAQHFLWRLGKGSLAVNSLRHHRHCADSPRCFRCKAIVEDFHHALIECPKSAPSGQIILLSLSSPLLPMLPTRSSCVGFFNMLLKRKWR